MRILLVHDFDSAATYGLTARLAALGHEVVGEVSTAAEAVEAAARTAPALALVTVALGGELGGLAAATAVRAHRSMPVVLLGTDAQEAAVAAHGMPEPEGFLVPPFGDRELRMVLELAQCRHSALRVSHELDGFFAVSNDLFCFLDFNGYFRRLNPAWERTLGFTHAELMSRPFIDFVHPDDRERTLNQNAEVRAGGHATGFENRYRCADGSYRWLLWNAAPQTVDRVIYSVARDITVRKEAEAERAELMRELEASLAEVSALQDILPICSYCRKIRDDEDFWHSVEQYISRHTKSRFSHGICPSCMATEVEPHFRALDGA